jgi:hypothetical protein
LIVVNVKLTLKGYDPNKLADIRMRVEEIIAVEHPSVGVEITAGDPDVQRFGTMSTDPAPETDQEVEQVLSIQVSLENILGHALDLKQ